MSGTTTLEALRAADRFLFLVQQAIAAEEARLLTLGHAFVEHSDEPWDSCFFPVPGAIGNVCGKPKAAHEAQPRPASSELRAAAERAVEAQANDTRTPKQKIADLDQEPPAQAAPISDFADTDGV